MNLGVKVLVGLTEVLSYRTVRTGLKTMNARVFRLAANLFSLSFTEGILASLCRVLLWKSVHTLKVNAC
jgi:hypothetical protein